MRYPTFFKLNVILIGGILLSQLSSAQDIRFSQYQSAPLILNPASAGAISNPIIRFQSRLQQFGPVAYRTGYASIALPVYLTSREAPGGGIGLNFLQDVAGQAQEYRTTQAQLAAAYNIYLDRYATHWISLGLQTGYRQIRVDFSQLNWPSQLRYNGFTGGSIPYENYPDQINTLGINAGFLWNYDPTRNPLSQARPLRFYAGMGLSNLNEPDLGFVTQDNNVLSMGYTVLAGGEFLVSERLSLAPDFLASWQNPFFTFQAGTYLTYHTQLSTPSNPVPSDFKLFAGTWYRKEKSLIFLVGIGGRKWQTALSYDAHLSVERRGVPNQYAMELSILYQWFPKNTPKTQSTPLF
jgi:type IX secretion system PorP/SprF family membrane protein